MRIPVSITILVKFLYPHNRNTDIYLQNMKYEYTNADNIYPDTIR